MGDYESRLYDIRSDINSLIERINRCDPTLCNEDWCEMTYNYDLDILNCIYKNIEVEEMFDIVTDLICTERHRLELEGKIEPYPTWDDELGPLPDEPRTTLNSYANKKRTLLQAKKVELETRAMYAQQLVEIKNESLKKTQNVPISYFVDGTPDVEEYESRLADEVEDIIRENNNLNRELNDKNKIIKSLQEEKIMILQQTANAPSPEPEKAFNTQTDSPCFTSRQMGILLTAVGRLTEERPPGKTTIGDIVERIAGYKPKTANANMKGTIPQIDVETVASAIESKFPKLAEEVRKL